MGFRLSQPHDPARCPTQVTATSLQFPLWQHYELQSHSWSDQFSDPSEKHLCKTTQTALLSAPAAAAGPSAWLQRCMQQQPGHLQQRQAANCRSGVAKSGTALDGNLSPHDYTLGAAQQQASNPDVLNGDHPSSAPGSRHCFGETRTETCPSSTKTPVCKSISTTPSFAAASSPLQPPQHNSKSSTRGAFRSGCPHPHQSHGPGTSSFTVFC